MMQALADNTLYISMLMRMRHLLERAGLLQRPVDVSEDARGQDALNSLVTPEQNVIQQCTIGQSQWNATYKVRSRKCHPCCQ